MNILKNNTGRLLVLTLLHFTVDFYGGLTIPLPEPTLTQHFSVSLSRIALLIGGCAIITNLVQPLSGWLFARGGIPFLLIVGPLLAACTALLGISSSFPVAIALLVAASLGIGLVHPEGALVAHHVSGTRKGMGMSLFMSGGYFGFALGSLVAGIWAEWRGLEKFWLLALPVIPLVILVWLSGLHRLEDHAPGEELDTVARIPFPPVLLLAICMAASMCLLVRLMPILLVRSFPGQGGQGWGGAAVFATGITGALGSFFWGHLSERKGRSRVIILALLAAIPFLYFLLHVKTPSQAPLWALGVGFTMGAVFPLGVILARQARGGAPRLRLGLTIGGSWGTGEVVFIVAGRYIDRFPAGAVAPVSHVLNLCWVTLTGAILLALFLYRSERGNRICG